MQLEDLKAKIRLFGSIGNVFIDCDEQDLDSGNYRIRILETADTDRIRRSGMAEADNLPSIRFAVVEPSA